MAGILEYSSDRTSNTTINGIGITGSDTVKHGNDAIQQLMADLRTAVTKITDKSAGSYTAVKADHNQCWRVTGTATINLTAAATLTAGWCLWVMADGATATIDPAGSEKINGGDTLALTDGNAALIFCTATDFRAIIFNAAFDASALLPKSGGTMTGGLSFGSEYAASAPSLARHIALYSTTYGFNVTANYLNYNSADRHRWLIGGVPKAIIYTDRFELSSGVSFRLSGDPSNALDAATKQYVDGLQGRAKAWVNFNGTGTVAIRAAHNVSSITDNGTGDYKLNFASAMADANYSLVVSGKRGSASEPVIGFPHTLTVSSARIVTGAGSFTPVDGDVISVAIFGN